MQNRFPYTNIQPTLPNEIWHYVKRSFEPLDNVKHQIEVVKNHLMKHHNVSIDLDYM